MVAIAEFGSGTFGKTGTNTATLFLRRKSDTPNLAEHYQNRIEQWQSGNFGFDGLFADSHLLQNYCGHCGFDLAQYQAFLTAQSKMPPEIAATEVFQEYRKTFDKKKLSKSTDVEKAWLDFAKEIEADKLRHFMLAANNPQNVLVIKMPSDTKEKKAFLGYEWSAAKGNEGIKYLGGQTETDEEGLQNLQGINKIQTPLFNPQNLFDETKLNSLIRQNFSGSLKSIPEHLAKFATLLPLPEMLDFGRADFDKAIRTSVQKKVEIVSNYPLVKLGELCDVRIGGTPPRAKNEYFTGNNLWVSISEMKGGVISDTKEKITEDGIKNSNVKLIPKGTTLLSFKLSIGRTAIAGADLYTNEAIAGLIPRNGDILNSYLFHIFNGKMIDLENVGNKAFGKSLNSKYLREDIKIPLPPLDIQQKIVEECQKIDDEFNRTRMKIEEYRAKIANIFNDLEIIQAEVKWFKINELCILKGISLNPQEHYGSVNYLSLENIEGNTGKIIGNYVHEYQSIQSIKNVFEIGDILYGKLRPNLNKVYLAEIDGICSTDILVLTADKEKIDAGLLSHYLRSWKFNKQVLTTVSGQQLPRTSWEKISALKIPVPNLETQKSIIAQINGYEAEIAACERKIQSLPAQKQAVLARYLN